MPNVVPTFSRHWCHQWWIAHDRNSYALLLPPSLRVLRILAPVIVRNVQWCRATSFRLFGSASTSFVSNIRTDGCRIAHSTFYFSEQRDRAGSNHAEPKESISGSLDVNDTPRACVRPNRGPYSLYIADSGLASRQPPGSRLSRLPGYA